MSLMNVLKHYDGLKSCDKEIFKNFIEYYHECWKLRCSALHNPELKKKVSKDKLLAIIEEASKEEVEGLRRCA